MTRTPNFLALHAHRNVFASLYLFASLVVYAGCSCGESESRPINADARLIDATAQDGHSDIFTIPPSDATTGDSPFEACETLSAVASARPVSLVFVVDTSGSMNCRTGQPCDLNNTAMTQPTADPNDSRWDVFRPVLTSAISGLRGDYEVGVFRYPDPDNETQRGVDSTGHPQCIDRAPLIDLTLVRDLNNLATTLNITPKGNTPTHDAMEFGYGIARRGRYSDGRFVVLATDGAAALCRLCTSSPCTATMQAADNMALETRVASMRDMGIRTFVIGVPGSDDFRNQLSRLAVAGGTAASACNPAMGGVCHFDLTGSTNLGTALQGALAQIGQTVASCTFTIPPNPSGTFDPNLVNVVISQDNGTMTTVPRDVSAQQGWNYTNGMAEVTLYGAHCDAARALRTGRVDVSFGCPTVIP